MTTLVGVQGDGWCALGADSKASDVDGSYIYLKESKIFSNGSTLIAGSGAVRTLNLLQYGWTAPRYRGRTPEEYMTRYFIPFMRKKIVESGSEWQKDGEVAKFDNALLVAVKGKIFKISDDYSWETSLSRLYRGGSGGDYALGALVALDGENVKDSFQAELLIKQAISAAIECDLFSGGKIEVVVQRA